MGVFTAWKEIEVTKTPCGKCGVTIEGSPWLLTIDTWIHGDRWVYWEAVLCTECKELLTTAIANFGVTFCYRRE